MARVELDGITRRFEQSVAIADITFEVPDGEFWVLVGPSGCGKSTILRTIAGLESATSGNLYIGDRLVNQVPARQRDVAMVFQNYALYPHMTVAENIAFGLKMRNADAKTQRERVETMARILDISHLLDRKPRQLSGGQQQRVALGRAIARQPQVFLLDEPLSNLDAQLRDGTRSELKQLHQQMGITTIYVTHDQVEAMTLADQIVILERGKIQQIGDPQSIYAQPANRMVATFLGNPPTNILPVTYRGEAFHIQGQRIPCPLTLRSLHDGQQFDLGIRPEQMRVSEDAHLITQVSLVEPLGREILVRVELLGERSQPTTLNVQVSPNVRLAPGDRLPLALDLNQLFLFDPMTGQRVHPN
ncbi:ABC transporter ATP-binding protein [Phormidesmis priestleyi ULC007]|uniref:ABC transporter ATP-binding protein n=1 Tax=Phormidesmis priestleyi ULC007 TaxID=1920490 RepID=A0A2T1DBG6_9CYAN|nr:ABC transporter ATP-binding protein [Phormidesmis priestleyi]PSB17819.1 ABC transporter ATP-binding protein [Phormidesmis priestleyi ULC007]PZO46467.1 MAG: ABC transporter ATP-binding protein [Phormidesmis priestleyi]